MKNYRFHCYFEDFADGTWQNTGIRFNRNRLHGAKIAAHKWAIAAYKEKGKMLVLPKGWGGEELWEFKKTGYLQDNGNVTLVLIDDWA